MITEARLKPGRYSLYKENGQGDSGLCWQTYDFEKTKEAGHMVWVENGEGLVKVGYGIRVGSFTARSYASQDWWQCSPVTQIMTYQEENEEVTEVKFRTNNSIYTAKSL